MPIRPDNAATDLLNYLPGINNESAYGGNESYGNALLVDGVDTRDPAAGSAWTFFNFNLVDEVQVGGLGAPAEFGSYTGAVVNTVTKSGGNRYAGLFDVYFTNDSLFGDNIKPEYVEKNPSLVDPSVTTKKLDVTGQLSGPLVKDKLFFFVAAQRFEVNDNPSGPIDKVKEVSPRFNAKLTWQPNPNDSLSANFQWDYYNVVGRCDFAAANCSQALTLNQDSPEAIWGLQWRHLFGSKHVRRGQVHGLVGLLLPRPRRQQAPPHRRLDERVLGRHGSHGYYDRGRNQLNASISHFAEAFGKHDLKFGVEIERSSVHSRYGSDRRALLLRPHRVATRRGQYLAYDYSYDLEGRNHRESVYAQDSWKPTPRLTINAGLRVDFVRGNSPVLDKKIYSNTNWAPAPRVRLRPDRRRQDRPQGPLRAVLRRDLLRQTTARRCPAARTSSRTPTTRRAASAAPRATASARATSRRASSTRSTPTMKHPRVDEWTAGIDRDLGRSTPALRHRDLASGQERAGHGVPRRAVDAQDRRRTSLTGQPLTVYNWDEPLRLRGQRRVHQRRGLPVPRRGRQRPRRGQHRPQVQGADGRARQAVEQPLEGRVSYVLSKTEGVPRQRLRTGPTARARSTRRQRDALVNTYGG